MLRAKLWARRGPGQGHSYLRRLFATTTATREFDIRQGGTVVVSLPPAQTAGRRQELEIVSAWQDKVVCETWGESALDMAVNVEAQTLLISARHGQSADLQPLRITTPQSIDLVITGDDVACTLRNKIEGDVSIECNAGTVELDKVRGLNLSLHLGTGSLVVKKLAEGSVVDVSAASVTAKMINGDSVRLESSKDVRVEAVYAQQLSINAAGEVVLGGITGAADVYSKEGSVTLSGIDGTFDALADAGSIKLQINKLGRKPSRASAPKGGITANISPETRAWVGCESTGVAGRAKITVVSDAFLPASPPGSAPGTDPRARPGFLYGLLTGQPSPSSSSSSSSLSRAGRSGKIDLEGAQRQSLSILGPPSSPPETATTPPTTPTTTGAAGKGEGEGEEGVVAVPVNTDGSPAIGLSLSAHGHVRLETLSWFEAIRRKHGFTDPSQGSKPVAPGRSASATQRAKDLAKSVHEGGEG